MENRRNKLDPSVSVDLLEGLKERYPNKVPMKGETLEDLRRLQGQQDVIFYISSILDQLESINNKGFRTNVYN